MKKYLLFISLFLISIFIEIKSVSAVTKCEQYSDGKSCVSDTSLGCVWNNNVGCIPNKCSEITFDMCRDAGCSPMSSQGTCTGARPHSDEVNLDEPQTAKECSEYDDNVMCNAQYNRCTWKNGKCQKVGSYSPKTGEERQKVEYDTLDLCASKGVLKVIYLGKIIVRILKFFVPFVLIVYISLDIFKMVNDPSNNKKVFPAIKGRLIAALLIFLVPTIIQLLLTTIGKDNEYFECYNNAEPPFSNATNK